MGTWVLSRLQMSYVYSLRLKLFATIPGIATQLSSISITAALGSREIQSWGSGGGRMDTEDKEVKHFAQGCSQCE